MVQPEAMVEHITKAALPLYRSASRFSTDNSNFLICQRKPIGEVL
jgi:hypothetical protein